LGGLRQLLAGGESLSPSHVNRVIARHPGLRLVNGYGPTENTTFTCCHTVSEHTTDGSVPIGTAINGTGVHLLDDQLNPVPDGHWGELYTTGFGLARGYLGHSGLTAGRFLPDPFASRPGDRMYRTGDVCRRRQDGALEFRGRNDDQVKIHGFRVEPGEVEAFLRSRPGVREAVVLPRDGSRAGEKSLMAFVVPDDTGADLSVPLYVALNKHLPRYMVPSSITGVEKFPLTTNGKVDRSALPVPHRRPRLVDNSLTAPETELERVLCNIWAEVLEVEEVGIHDDLFELGGNSLMAVDLLGRVQDAVAGASLTVRDIFEYPSVAELSAHLLTKD
jgi:acyl-coenzyme A synthetase/AMP-(fatty) acid ligase